MMYLLACIGGCSLIVFGCFLISEFINYCRNMAVNYFLDDRESILSSLSDWQLETTLMYVQEEQEKRQVKVKNEKK